MASTITPKRRRRWPWILLAVLLTPLVVVAGAGLNYLTLDRDAKVLKRQVMQATGANWDTTVQFSIGRPTFALLRACFAAIPSEKTAEARLALRAVRSASVGVYQLQSESVILSRGDILNAADRVMQGRGWERAVGVMDEATTVMIFVPQNPSLTGRVCLAVVDGNELVVVSAQLDPRALADLVKLNGSHGHWRDVLSVAL